MEKKLTAPDAPSLKRPSNIVKPKVEIVIVCEGENTEPVYFDDCVKEYGAGLVKLRPITGAGVPMTIVKASIEERDNLIKKKRNSNDSFDGVFRVWAVFDRDEHPRVDEALNLAREHHIDVAFSDPCFEVWPILHLVDYGVIEDRHSVQRRLNSLMPKYDHSKGAIVDFHMIKDHFPEAYSRSIIQLRARETENIPNGCPSTTVGILVKKIFENGKSGFRARSRSR